MRLYSFCGRWVEREQTSAVGQTELMAVQGGGDVPVSLSPLQTQFGLLGLIHTAGRAEPNRT